MTLEKAPYNEGMFEVAKNRLPMTKARMFGLDDQDLTVQQDMNTSWKKWFDKLRILVTSDESGVTADRPTSNLYVGRRFFDTTLGKPIYVKSLSPTVWVDGVGTVS